MNRITIHHTGGTHTANATDLRAYHRLVQGDGSVVGGTHPIATSAPGRELVAGGYAAHTRALNSGNIGVAACALAGGVWSNPFASRWYPTGAQLAALVVEVARLARAYGIGVDRRTVLTHAEVELTLGVRQAGKWDFDFDPWNSITDRDPIAIGDAMRARIRDALSTTGPRSFPPQTRRTLRQGSSGDDVRELQRILALVADGIFGPITRAQVVSFQESRELLPDGVVGPMTWAALLPARK